MRVIVTGSRHLPDTGQVATALAAATTVGDTIVHGACPTGADAQADTFARTRGRQTEPHPADWGRLGRAAGPARNQHMVSLGADLVIAFPHPTLPSPGTWGCVRAARRAGLPVIVWQTR